MAAMLAQLGLQFIPAPGGVMPEAEYERIRLTNRQEWCDHLKETGMGLTSLQGEKGKFFPLHADNAVRGQRSRLQDQSPVLLSPGAMEGWAEMAKVLSDKEVMKGAVVHELPVLDKAVSHLMDVSLFLADKVADHTRLLPGLHEMSSDRAIYLSGSELRQLVDTVNGVGGLLLKRRAECIAGARSRASFATPLETAVWAQKQRRSLVVQAGERAIQDAASEEERAEARVQMKNQLAAFDRSLAKEDVTGASSKAKK